MKIPKNFGIIYKSIVIGAFCLISFGIIYSQTQDEEPPKESELETPYQTVYQHLRFLQKDTYKPELASKTLDVEDPASEKAQELAVKLKKIYDGLGLFVLLEDIPQDPNYRDSVSGLQKYVLFESRPRIYVEKTDGKWLYSKKTVEAIPEIYDEVFPFELSDFEATLPGFLKQKILGMKFWKFIAIFLYLVIGFILYLLFAWFFGYLLIKMVDKFRFKKIALRIIPPVAKPLSLMMVTFLILNFLPVLQIPVRFNSILTNIFGALIPVFISLIAYKLSDLVADIFSKLAEKTSSTVDDNLIPLARKILKVIVIVFGSIYVLKSLNVDITPLIAGVSVGGLAIALAAQDTVKNLFGSVTIFSDQPFEIGDWIVFSGGEGMVEEVGVRSSRIRTFYNSLISIPNGKLADMMIDNMGRREFRRYSTNIAITYDTPPELIDAYVKGLREIVEMHPDTRKDYYQIHLNSFGDFSLNILFYIFFKVPDWTAELIARHDVINEAIRLAHELGVRFAFPTQTLFVEEFPEKQSLTPKHIPDMEKYGREIQEFINSRKLTYKPEKGGE